MSGAAGAYLLDARFLEPPEPFVQAMAMLETLPAGEEMCLLLYREPHPLYKVLQQNGYAWRSQLCADGTFEIFIRRA